MVAQPRTVGMSRGKKKKSRAVDISIATGYGSFARRGSTRVALTLAAATRTAA